MYACRAQLEFALLVKLIPPASGERFNCSEIVNADRIAEARLRVAWLYEIVLTTGEELNWSRRYRTPSLEELERG